MIADPAELAGSGAEPGQAIRRDGGTELVVVERPMLGGRVGVHVAADPGDVLGIGATRAADTTLDRMAAWASRLTRFETSSELSRLNADPRPRVSVGPTLAAVIDWGREAEVLTDGLVNIAMLDARLAAEGLAPVPAHSPATLASGAWSLARLPGRTSVRRPFGLRFDLDGVAKGWLADRAADLLAERLDPRVAVVDADGDVAIRLASGEACRIGIEDPPNDGFDLAVLHLPGDALQTYGVATSGTTRHAWGRDATGAPAHHLIDPRTGRPALTDLVQATVLARSARVAEAFAKAAVIVGSSAAIRLLDRPALLGALLLTSDRRLVLTGGIERYLEAPVEGQAS